MHTPILALLASRPLGPLCLLVRSFVHSFVFSLIAFGQSPQISAIIGSIMIGLVGILPLFLLPVNSRIDEVCCLMLRSQFWSPMLTARPASLLQDGRISRTLRNLLGCACGGLLADVFLHLLPEVSVMASNGQPLHPSTPPLLIFQSSAVDKPQPRRAPGTRQRPAHCRHAHGTVGHCWDCRLPNPGEGCHRHQGRRGHTHQPVRRKLQPSVHAQTPGATIRQR